MDDQDDEEKVEEENEEDYEDCKLKSYSKRGFFGKSSKQYKLANLKVSYKPRIAALKNFKAQVEAGKSKFNTPFGNTNKWQLEHKKTMDSLKSTTKLTLNFKNYYRIQNYELNSTLKFKLAQNPCNFTAKIKKQNQFSSSISFSKNLWQKLKVTYGLQLQKKREKELNYGGKMKFQLIRNTDETKLFSFLKQYNELISLNFSKKYNSKNSLEFLYRSNLITQSNKKFYIEQKTQIDPFAKNFTENPISHNYTFNAQDSIGVLTFNSSINFQNAKIKSKQASVFLQYDKKYRFGLQRKNETYELMVELYKIKTKIFKSIHFYASTKNILTIFKGKFNILKNYYNYDLSIKFKPGGGNFYKDFSFGLNAKWNI